MRAAAMVQDVRVAGLELVSFIERLSSFFWMVSSEVDYAEPHPGIGILREAGRFFLERGGGFLEMVDAERADAEKEIGPMEMRLQRERLVKAGDGVLISALLL